MVINYLRPGQAPPKGAVVRRGKHGGVYYETSAPTTTVPRPRLNRSTYDRPIEDLSPDEVEAVRDRMSEAPSYTARDLESAKRWLHNKPHLRARFGRDYYDFAVQVATIISEGRDPEEIDWGAMDRSIGVSDARRELEAPMLAKDAGAVTSSTAGASNPVYGRRKLLLRSVAKCLYHPIARAAKVKNVTKEDRDWGILADFIQDSLFAKRFDGMNWSTSDAIKDYLLRAITHSYDEDRVKRYITRKAPNATSSQAERIWRGENHELRAKIREFALTKDDPQRQVSWIGPDDSRTTKVCKRISARTKNGVSVDELKEIISEEVGIEKSAGRLPPDYDEREFSPHFNCRHTFV